MFKVGKCRFKKNGVGAKITGYVNLPKGNEKMLKEAVATVGPVSVSMDSKHSAFHLYAYGKKVFSNQTSGSQPLFFRGPFFAAQKLFAQKDF